MLRNIQSQNLAGYSGNLSDQAKKRVGISPKASQPATPVQAPQITQTPYPGLTSPSSNLQSPSVPGTVNVAGTQTQIPMQTSGKSGGFNKGPVAPTPGTTTPGNMGEKTRWFKRTPEGGFEYASGATMPEGGGWNEDTLSAPTGGQRPGNKIQLPDGWTKPNDGMMRAAVMVDWINERTGERTSRTLGVAPPPGQGWKTVRGGGGQWMASESQAKTVPAGQSMTLRDAFSTLQTAGYGSF